MAKIRSHGDWEVLRFSKPSNDGEGTDYLVLTERGRVLSKLHGLAGWSLRHRGKDRLFFEAYASRLGYSFKSERTAF